MLPGIAVAALITSGCNRFSRHRATTVVTCLTVAVLLTYGAMTQMHINIWKDSAALWTRVIQIQPFDRAYFTRALHYVDVGRYQEAVDDYTTCLTLMTDQKNPEAFNLYAFRGEALVKSGRYNEALQDFSAAVEIYPHNLYFYHRAFALKGLGRLDEAEVDLKRAGKARGQMYWFNL